MKKMKLQVLIEVAILAALALVLDLLPSIKIGPSISISFAMAPIFICAFRWGIVASMISGLLWGVLQIAIGDAWILTPTQAFIEYFVAFTCIGFAGIFKPAIQNAFHKHNVKKAMIWVVSSVLIGTIARYFWHFLAGMIFFKSYAYEAGKAPFIYSLTMNGITASTTFVVCSIVLILLLSKASILVTSAKDVEHPDKMAS